MKQDKVSIIIACYNDADYVSQSVESAYKQTWSNKEIILIDDGSNAETKEVLATLKSKIDILITQDNQGVSAARNNGINAATGDYILVLDSDDFFEPRFCEQAVGLMEQDKDVKIVTCYSKWFNNPQDFKIFKPTGGNIKDGIMNNVAMGSSMFRKKDWILAVGYDVSMQKGYEDWEFYIRILKNGGKAKVIPEVLFNYRNKPNSRNKGANLIKYDLLKYIYLKHADLYYDHFEYFIEEWLESIKKSEAFKQQVMDSLDYKIGNKLLKPFRILGFFKKRKNN